tara:strand:+ start:1810 stop:2001 length:192 start_codon:yes stop_codon:yes gene_type:complete
MDYEKSKMEKLYSQDKDISNKDKSNIKGTKKYDLDFIDDAIDKEDKQKVDSDKMFKEKIQKEF